MREAGSKATAEVIQTWIEVYHHFGQLTGERRERLRLVAEQLGVSVKVAKRRLRNYEAMNQIDNGCRAPETGGRTSKARKALSNRTLECVDCGHNFTWSFKEQAYYKERGFSHPKRCKACRQKQDERQARKESKK